MEPTTLRAARRALMRTVGGRVLLGDEEQLGGSDRSTVSRLRVLVGPASAPASVIVKRAVAAGSRDYDPDDAAGPASRLCGEWAGLQFISSLADAAGATLVPRFYAGDREAGLIILEDFGAERRLADLLLDEDARAAEAALLAYAAALGRMHALAAGRREEYARLRASLGPQRPVAISTAAEAAIQPEDLAQAFRGAIAAAGMEIPSNVEGDLVAVVRFWAEPGPFLTYVHQDPCPDNCLVVGRGVRLLDFEFGGYGHALIDGVYGRVHFPTCWCVNRLPAALPLRMERAYRAELARGCPAAADDALFSRAVVEACAYWTAGMLHWAIPPVLQRDEDWGIATWRQRVLLRLDALADAAAQAGHLEALGEAARALATRWRAAWPRAASELPYYPAFRS
jgi:hypothetical protein